MLCLKLSQGDRWLPVMSKLWIQRYSSHLWSEVLSITHGVKSSRKLPNDNAGAINTDLKGLCASLTQLCY